jgi:hypothetical protein
MLVTQIYLFLAHFGLILFLFLFFLFLFLLFLLLFFLLLFPRCFCCFVAAFDARKT